MSFNDLKDQRDRFLGFAFANADALIEVDLKTFNICFSAGALKGLVDQPDKKIVGTDFLDLFSPRDHGMIKAMKNRFRPGQRVGPVLVNLKDNGEAANKIPPRKALLSGLGLPTNPNQIFFTLSKIHPALMDSAEAAREEQQGPLLEPDGFAEAARKALEIGQQNGTKLDMTFIDLVGSDDLKKKLGAEQWASLNDHFSGILKAYSSDGKTAAQMGQGRFGIVHDAGITADMIREEIESAARDSDPEGKGLNAATNTIDLDDNSLSEHEMAKAIVYTINKFASGTADFDIKSLKSGFDDFLAQNAQSITNYKTIINQQRFDLKFQPIVDLKSGNTAYYEVLVRFEGGASPFAAIEFIEDVGLSPELDLAICGRVLNYLLFNNKDKNLKLSVNLSGRSVQDKNFISKLRYKLDPHKKTDIPKQLIFEITESSEIKDFDQVNEFIKALQEDGFKVALDDFGAGSASFQYLQRLHVDAIKIDGQYVKTILNSSRDEAMVRNLVRMCKDLGIQVVAEFVETQQLATMLKSMDVDYGQGYYFAKPLDEPIAIPKKPF